MDGSMGPKARGRSMESQHRSVVREAMREAMAQGGWIGVSDACIDAKGRASVAWAVFDPQGVLAASGAEGVELSESRSTADAESQGALMAACSLHRLGAPKALLLCDCEPAIERLSGRAGAHALGRAEFARISEGRYDMRWAPRSMMGPANDASRAVLGLRPEGAMARGWLDWMAKARQEAGSKPPAKAVLGVKF
jgi:hypothetical protein